MARFTIGRPIATRTPSITVDAGLEPGRHRFQLEVVTSNRRKSKPDVITVEITRGRILEPVRPEGPLRPTDILRPDGTLRRPTGPIRPGGSVSPGGPSDPIPE